MIFHGTIFLLVGLFAGIPYGRSIARGADPTRAGLWRAAHTGLIGTGVLTIVLALALQAWSENGSAADLVRYTMLTSGYGFSMAMPLAAVSGARGLIMAGGAVNRLVFVGYAVSVLATLLGAVTFLGIAWVHG